MCLLHSWLVRSDFLMGLLHFHFLVLLRCQSASWGRFLKLLGAPWAVSGGPWEQLLHFWGPLGTPLVTILVSWGALWRSHGSLGTTLVVILMVFMSTPSSGHNFYGFDDQITKNNTPKPLKCGSHHFCTSHWHLSCAPHLCVYNLRFSFAYLTCTSRLYLSFAPPACIVWLHLSA